MITSLSLFAPEPGAPGSPVASRTGVFVNGLLGLLEASDPPLDLKLEWLQPYDAREPIEVGDWVDATRWSAGELRRILRAPSPYLVFVYPHLPVFAYTQAPSMLARLRRALQVLSAKSRLTRQRIVVVVMDLPVEMDEGRAAADGRVSDVDDKRIHEIERTLFRAAWRIVAPDGLAEAIADRHGIEGDHIVGYRRAPYLPATALDTPPPIEFDKGDVNFFYSGDVDPHVAPNFREVLRSIRNAPKTRLHVVGPGRDSVREWLVELDVPNVRHHGQLGPAEHDWLAQQCDVGLILYPTEDSYSHLRPTLKYSAYLANGLAVLSTDLHAVADNIRQDRVGQAMPIRELALEVLRWSTKPKLWAGAKTRAAQLAEETRSPPEHFTWIKDIAEDR
jgi:hypothetical protein